MEKPGTLPAVPEAAPAAEAAPEPSPAVATPPAETPASPQERERPTGRSAGGPLELAVEAGWNAPSGLGARAMVRIFDSDWLFGVGLAPFGLWTPKASLMVRHSRPAETTTFFQFSVTAGLTSEGHMQSVAASSGAQTAWFTYTGGRTFDFVYGLRHFWGRFFTEGFAGYSLGFQGTALQDLSRSRVRIDASTKDMLHLSAPGGFVLGGAAGWAL